MTPVTLLGCSKISTLLTANNALPNAIAALGSEFAISIPLITTDSVVLSSASSDLADLSIQLSYPRVCIYPVALKNAGFEKFRSLSGTVSVCVDILASGNLVSDTDRWVHYYVQSITGLLGAGAGDLGDGIFFSGLYDIQFQPPKAGGLGFVQVARLTLSLAVSIA